jgi:alanine dehydrogenase
MPKRRHLLPLRSSEIPTKSVQCRYNNVDMEAARRLGIAVVRVPAYSPNAVAEHTLALILALNRNIHRAYNRVRDRNFALSGLVGFDVSGKTAGVIGTGKIGTIVARLLWHLRCRVLAVDQYHVRILYIHTYIHVYIHVYIHYTYILYIHTIHTCIHTIHACCIV